MISSSFLQPFLTYYRDDPDYNSTDIEHEINLMIVRNNAVEDYLEGNQSEDYLFDLFAAQGIEPSLYVEAVENEINYLIANPQLLYS